MNVCHFIFDHLSRIYLYQKIDPETHFFISENYQYYKDALIRYVDNSNLIFSNKKRVSIQCSKLLISSNILNDFKHPAHYGNIDLLNFLRKIPLSRENLPRLKIYISRSDASTRKIINEDLLLPELLSRWYLVVNLTKLSFEDQATLFSRASHVIGQHGAGLTNLIYSPTDCKILEIFNPYYGTWSFWHIFNQLKFEYYSYVSSDPVLPTPDYQKMSHDSHHGQRNIILDIDHFLQFLDSNSF